METPELILFEGLVAKSRIGEMRFGEGLYLRPAGRLSDSASVGAARVKMVSFGIKGKSRETRLMGREETSWPFKEVVYQELSFKTTFFVEGHLAVSVDTENP